MLSRILITLATSVGALGYFKYNKNVINEDDLKWKEEDALPIACSRERSIEDLKGNEYDVLVVGGGATGSGIAMDAQLRGLKVALIECNDFASGSSSRSTKLVHGGVRYLEKAIMQLSPAQMSLVFEALHERSKFLEMAPFLTRKLPIMTPSYQWWELPYFYIGMKLYDFMSLSRSLYPSTFYLKKSSLEKFPNLNPDKLKGTIVYYDGQMDDSRMVISMALTAALKGATICNYLEVVDLLKTEDGIVNGVSVIDHRTLGKFEIRAKCIVNATGPFVDRIRKMDNEKSINLVSPSSGTHIIIPGHFAPKDMGLIIPRTDDDRVIFLVPWLNHLIAGTTDIPERLDFNPIPNVQEVDWVLGSINKYLSIPPSRADVLASWKGLRPLVAHANTTSENLVRDHLIETSSSGLITITGGKWTTYRLMAQDVVDRISKILKGRVPSTKLPIGDCLTQKRAVIGGNGYNENLISEIMKNHSRRLSNGKLVPYEQDIAEHLVHSYGTRAIKIVNRSKFGGFGERVVPGYPFILAEVETAILEERACTVADVILRRFRLGFLNYEAAKSAIPIVANVLAKFIHLKHPIRPIKELERKLEMEGYEDLDSIIFTFSQEKDRLINESN